ncbi:hypothetical protein CCR85_13575 [Rhodothalassium salexigens]|uniref:sensor histidine kinase n=1 Tax=Rhodothalassium salexigens TaxID=1086 RepID=UPI0019142BC8|nr:ATP-binding protein [Rhodothalassium salexigens]MBK5912517.1 hypothetical protein [Rhodothalassium salexigens]MBK5919458.1 hypothetical protein [Rhodothalassium salexigens]
MDFIDWLFDKSGFAPHGYCLIWDPWLLAMTVTSDGLIAVSYFAIPAALLVIALRRPDLGGRRYLWLFAAFIITCGITHVMSVVTLWEPYYALAASFKALCAVASVMTATMIWPFLPRVLSVPSVHTLEATNARLLREIAEREQAEKQLATVNATLEERIRKRTEDLHRLNAQLEQAYLKAESDRAAKSQFLAQMSHELRTPLNAILGFAEILKDDALNRDLAAPYRDYADNIHRSGSHLLAIINDLLEMSRIEAGRYDPNLADQPIVPLIDEHVEMLAVTARDGGVTLEEDYDADLGTACVDAKLIRQVMGNLISNAIKFTEPGGRVRVFARREADTLTLGVADTGIGITPDQQESVFQPFIQGRQRQGQVQQGTGLGLAIVKAAAEMHGGDVGIESRPGQGTTIWIDLPLASEDERV